MIERLTRFALICLCVLPVWIILRRPWKRPVKREIALCLFVAYIAALLVMALEGSWASPAAMLQSAQERLSHLGDLPKSQIHLTPLRTIRTQLASIDTDESRTQLLGNSLLFLPWGFFLPLLWKNFRRFLPVAGMCLLLTCFIEGTQLFIGRTVDVDDLILNFLGSMCGAELWLAYRKLPRRAGGASPSPTDEHNGG